MLASFISASEMNRNTAIQWSFVSFIRMFSSELQHKGFFTGLHDRTHELESTILFCFLDDPFVYYASTHALLKFQLRFMKYI